MKPIILSTEDVRAILDGRKTMMRIPIKNQDGIHPRWNNIGWLGWEDGHGYKLRQPYQPGDVLWVRETFAQIRCIETGNVYTFYAANELDYDTVMTTYQCDDNGFETDRHIPWRNGIHMPREAARLFLRVTDVRVERLNQITNNDILREGFRSESCKICVHDGGSGCEHCFAILNPFRKSWDARNAKRGYGWDSNPWVWVYTFERITKEEGEHGH